MRILQVVKSLKRNGTETSIMNVFKSIDRNKYKFDFLLFDNSKDGYYEEAIELGAKVYYITPRNQSPIKYYRQLNQFFKHHKGEYDAIHVNDMSISSVAPLYFAKKYGIPKRILHFHGSNCQGLHNKILHNINKNFIKILATQYLACSRSAAKWGYSATGLLPHVKVVNNGIDIQRFSFNVSERNTLRKELGLSDIDKVIIHVGSFNRVKNHIFLIDVFALAHKADQNLKLILIGDGPLFDEIKSGTYNLGLQDYVLFLGRQENIPGYMSAADCLVLPSYHEGLPMVFLEAQASGLPIITSMGVSEEAKTSDNFLRINLNDSKEMWKDRILDFVNLGNNDRTFHNALFQFSINNTMKTLVEIYNAPNS